jgi:phospholipid/cholesterol/gamma-HCH transport system substrate-binding protein
MERNANYALVGVISTVLLIAAIVFILWLTNFALSAKYDNYNVIFHGPISGLSKGGEVTFNGIKVGEVSDIRLDAKDPNLVVATVRLQSDTPVREDSYATLEPQGITGVTFVQITAGTTSKPLLKDLPLPAGAHLPTIYAKGGTLANLLAGGGTMIQKGVEVLNRANEVLSDENIKKFSDIISDVQSVTAELRARKQIIGDADKALVNAGQAAEQIKTLAKSGQGLLDADGKRTVVKIGDAAGQIEGAAADVRKLIAKVQGPTGEFAANSLPQLAAAIASLQEATENLNRLVSQVQQNPRGLIEKPNAKQVEVKP